MNKWMHKIFQNWLNAYKIYIKHIFKNNQNEHTPIFNSEQIFEDEKYEIFEKKSQMTEYSSMLEILDYYGGKDK